MDANEIPAYRSLLPVLQNVAGSTLDVLFTALTLHYRDALHVELPAIALVW